MAQCSGIFGGGVNEWLITGMRKLRLGEGIVENFEEGSRIKSFISFGEDLATQIVVLSCL